MNFNAHAFVRRATAALGKTMPEFSFDTEAARAEHVADWNRVASEIPSLEKLDKAVGADWWKYIFRDIEKPDHQRKELVEGLCSRLQEKSRYAHPYEILERPHHSTPKYVLVFASRFSGAVVLINNAVVKARDTFVDDTMPAGNALFELRPTQWVPEPADAREMIRAVLRKQGAGITRVKLIENAIIDNFGIFKDSIFRQQIKAMYENGELLAEDSPRQLNKDSVIQLARKQS